LADSAPWRLYPLIFSERENKSSIDGPVSVELKLADKCSGPVLFKRLKNQLCGDYFRDNRSSRGIFLLVFRGEQPHWDIPGRDKTRVNFEGLISALQVHWSRISPRFPKIDEITVIGIDLTKRMSVST